MKKIALLLVIISIVILSGCNKTPGTTIKDKADSSKKDPSRVAAKDFELSNINGDKIKLSELKGKVVVLNFWATWCPPCREELPGFIKIAEEYKDNSDIVFAFVDVAESKEQVVDFLKENNYNTMVPLLDITNEVSTLYKVTGIPTTFIIDKDGNIAASKVGFMEDSLLKQYIENEI